VAQRSHCVEAICFPKLDDTPIPMIIQSAHHNPFVAFHPATAVCGYARAIAPTPQYTQLVAPLLSPPPSAPPTLGGIISPICRTSGRERLRVSRSMTYI
jgi:hypothetical protein